jgi:nitroreductase
MSDETEAQDATLRLDRQTVAAALEVAVRASSIHNTQPWRWRLEDTGLSLRADRSRQLAVADPDGHSLHLSCGAALYLTEVGLRAAGWQVATSLLPDAADPDLLAVFTPTGWSEPTEAASELADAAMRRRCDRRPFAAEQLDDATRETLRAAAGDAAARIDYPDGPEQHIELAVAVSHADRAEREDEAYLAEMSHWLRDPDVHAMVDGVPVAAIPHVPADAPRHTDVPLRDFEVGVAGRQLIERDVDERPLIAVVFTEADRPRDHLEAGIAMMRLMLRAEQLGLASCPLSQAVDFAAFRARLQNSMGWVGYPQMLLRLGRPLSPVADLPRTPRRPVSAVLDVLTR